MYLICGSVGEVVRNVSNREGVAGKGIESSGSTRRPENHIRCTELGTENQHGLLAS